MNIQSRQEYYAALEELQNKALALDTNEIVDPDNDSMAPLYQMIVQYEKENGLVCPECGTPDSMPAGCYECTGG